MDMHDEVERFLSQPPRPAEAIADDLRAVEADLARLESSWQMLETAVAGATGQHLAPDLIHLRQRLAARRDGLHGNWFALLLAWRAAGGVVSWHLPAQPLSQRHEATPVEASEPSAMATDFPPAAADPVPRAPSVPVNDQQLHRLQAALRGEDAAPRAQPQAFDSQRWMELSSALGEQPAVMDTEVVVRGEYKRMERFARPERLTWVAELPRDVQCLLIGHLVARARCLQEAPALHVVNALDLDKPLEQLFSAWTSHQRIVQPGFVHGLGRHHAPERGSWQADARALWLELAERTTLLHDEPTLNPERELRSLEQLLEAHTDAQQVVAQLDVAIASGVAQDDPRMIRLLRSYPDIVKFARFKPLRRAIRAMEVDEEAEADDTVPGPPPEWPHWPVVRERRVIILGGSPREQARTRIERAFAMGELTWVQVDQHKQLDSLAQRIRSGGLDLLILLQSFASHKASDKLVEACRDGGVPFVPIEHGYGVARIQRAIEEHVGGRQRGEAAGQATAS